MSGFIPREGERAQTDHDAQVCVGAEHARSRARVCVTRAHWHADIAHCMLQMGFYMLSRQPRALLTRFACPAGALQSLLLVALLARMLVCTREPAARGRVPRYPFPFALASLAQHGGGATRITHLPRGPQSSIGTTKRRQAV